jgi:hypothetical protein
MHILLSPSKTLNEQVKIPSLDFTQPHFLKQAAQLVEILKKISPSQIQRLMNVNPKLADLNANRFCIFTGISKTGLLNKESKLIVIFQCNTGTACNGSQWVFGYMNREFCFKV